MTRQEFVAVVAPIAQKLWDAGDTFIFPSIRLAQTLLETGGKIHPWKNIVGYKVGSGKLTPYWHGHSVNTKTWEVYDGVRHDNITANWRAYASIEDCLRDQDLLFQLDRYKDVRQAKTPEDQAVALYRCGYATDPDYHKKLIEIARGFKQYDTQRKPQSKEGKRMQLQDWQWTMLGDALTELSKTGGGTTGTRQLLSYEWAEKAYKRDLTLDEVLFINTVALARSQKRDVEVR